VQQNHRKTGDEAENDFGRLVGYSYLIGKVRFARHLKEGREGTVLTLIRQHRRELRKVNLHIIMLFSSV